MSEKEKVVRFSVSLPSELFVEFDKRVENLEYSSRSEYVRDLIREKMVQDEWNTGSKEKMLGVLCIAYSHHQSDLVMQMLELEHHAKVEIICTNHLHVDHENCMESINLRGTADEIEKFSAKIAGLKGVKFAKLTKVAITKA
ncbi:MAG: nickel-responsive transcriptional regulator NikR [Campylobacter sp.]|nr:nickel-responsive transcriptional regulator NikR [Campylobacter sp.]